MVKDLIANFKAAAQQNDSDNVIITVNRSNDKGPNLNKFYDETNNIQKNIDHINDLVDRLNELYAEEFKIGFKEIDKSRNKKIELMGIIKKVSKNVQIDIKNIHEDLKKIKHQETSTEYRLKANVYNFLNRTFENVMLRYNEIQLKHREKIKDQILKQSEISKKELSSEELENAIESGKFGNIFIKDHSDSEKAKQLADLNAKRDEILKLESSIRELNELFLDMAQRIEDHGELLNRIEYLVQNTADYVENAKKEVGEAAVYKIKTRRRKFFCYSFLILFLLVFVIYVIIELK